MRRSPKDYWKYNRFPFDENYWTPGIPQPTLLPARLSGGIKTLRSVSGVTFLGVGAGDRVYVVASQHRDRRFLRVTVIHPANSQILFTVTRGHYSIG